jgi:C4-dicarboxylate transporter DctQ subunit
MKIAEKARAIINRLITALAVAAAGLIVADALAVSAEVLMRRFLGVTHAGLFEITEYSLLWITFLAAAWLLKNNGHIRVDIVVSRLNPRLRALINIVTTIICAILFGVLAWYSGKLTLLDYQTGFSIGSALRPFKWPIEIIIPICFLLLFIETLMKTYEYLTSWKVVTEGQPTQSDITPRGEQ